MQSGLADVGVIGGSGFYSLLSDPTVVPVSTPYGLPSAELTIGMLGGRRVAFLPRHGSGHQFAPHRVPYRANLWALRAVGVRQVVGASAVGSLTDALGPGALVLPDQLIDRTSGRLHTYNDTDSGVTHIGFADPYCAQGRAAARRAAGGVGGPSGGVQLTPEATLLVINGPRFSSRAESRDYQRTGASLIGMTGMPEAALARELALCFTLLCVVTDHDAGVQAGNGVTHAEVMQMFSATLPVLRELLTAVIAELPLQQGSCACAAVYEQTPPAFELP